MGLVPYEPFRQLANMRKEFDRMFQDLPLSFDNDHQVWSIRADLYENETELVAAFDIPGLTKKEDVAIEIENNMLTISGALKRSYEVNEDSIYRKERYMGRFHRSISLPSPVSDEGVRATYKNGVLEVRMPKLKTENKKRIDVTFH